MLVKDCYLKFLEFIGDEHYPVDFCIDLYNRVENELALEHFPLEASDVFTSNMAKYENFYYQPCKIISCENETYKVKKDCIVSKDKKALGKVRYTYIPPKKLFIIDESSYADIYFECVIFGMLSEYYLTKGMWQEAGLYNQRYLAEIRKLDKCPTCNPPKSVSNIKKPISMYEVIEEKPTISDGVRKSYEGSFVDLLNKEMRELITSAFKQLLQNEMENAKQQRDTLRAYIENNADIEEDVNKFCSKQEIWWDGKYCALKELLGLV